MRISSEVLSARNVLPKIIGTLLHMGMTRNTVNVEVLDLVSTSEKWDRSVAYTHSAELDQGPKVNVVVSGHRHMSKDFKTRGMNGHVPLPRTVGVGYHQRSSNAMPIGHPLDRPLLCRPWTDGSQESEWTLNLKVLVVGLWFPPVFLLDDALDAHHHLHFLGTDTPSVVAPNLATTRTTGGVIALSI